MEDGTRRILSPFSPLIQFCTASQRVSRRLSDQGPVGHSDEQFGNTLLLWLSLLSFTLPGPLLLLFLRITAPRITFTLLQETQTRTGKLNWYVIEQLVKRPNFPEAESQLNELENLV